MYLAHNYEIMTQEKRPQDPNQDLKGWTFKSSEHGGEYPDSMPQSIRATDAEGRSCLYEPVRVGGKVVDFKYSTFSSKEGSYVEYKL